MELAPSCLCFFVLQLSPNASAAAHEASAGPRGRLAGTWGSAGGRSAALVGAVRQLLFGENPPEDTRAAADFAQFASN